MFLYDPFTINAQNRQISKRALERIAPLWY
jgi:hypothetical protein